MPVQHPALRSLLDRINNRDSLYLLPGDPELLLAESASPKEVNHHCRETHTSGTSSVIEIP